MPVVPDSKNKMCRRGGFHIHDWSKGFTHGCIEVPNKFFARLVQYIVSHEDEKTLSLIAKYLPAPDGKYGTYTPETWHKKKEPTDRVRFPTRRTSRR